MVGILVGCALGAAAAAVFFMLRSRASAQAIAAAGAILSRYRGEAKRLSFESLYDPRLEPNDVVQVSIPDGTSEQYIADSVEIGLDGATMSVGTRLTRGGIPAEAPV